MITYQDIQNILSVFPQWSIFPVTLFKGESKIEKRPAVPWKTYMDRQPTDEELHAWFDEPRFNAIGLATGKVSGVVVVDLDTDQIPEGYDLTSPLISKTISGGRHFYYRWDEEMRNDAKIEGLPIDFRGDGGFVVLPPSMIGDMKYEWFEGSWPCPEFMLDVLPQSIKETLKGRKSEPQKVINYQGGSALPEFFKAQKAEYGEGTDLVFDQAGKGERNVRASEVAGLICRELTPDKWENYGWPRLTAWNDGNQPPLGESELRTTWQSICNAELRKNPAVIATEKVAPEEFCKIFTGSQATEEFKHLQNKYGEGLTTGYEELDYYFKFLPEQLYMISAPTHVGKSTFALNMCARIASLGDDVLFCSLEQGIFIEPRVRSMLGGDFPEHLSILTSDKMLMIDQLIQVVEKAEHKPKLICVDHIHFLKKGGRGATEDIDEIVINLQNMAKKLEVPVIVICHVRKLNTDKAPEMDDLKDSSSLSQVPSVVIFLYRKQNENKQAFDSILSNEGQIIIAKNRIQGKTGKRHFELLASGAMVIKNKQESLYFRKVEDIGVQEAKDLFS